MQDFLIFWKNMFNFTGKTPRHSYWLGYIMFLLVGFGLRLTEGLVISILFDMILNPSPLDAVYGIAGMIALLASTVRRLNDAGYSWRSLFWVLIPGLGIVAILARLCGKSV